MLALLLWAFFAAIATVVIGWASFSADFTTTYPWLVVVALVTVAVSGVLPQLKQALPRYDPVTRTRIDWSCKAAVNRILDEFSGLDARSVGVHGFLVRWRVRRRWPFIQKELVRVGQFRMDHNRDSSGIHWTKGKGLIGVAWQTGNREGADLTSLNGLSEAEWTELPSAEQWGLTYEEFSRVQNYGAVIAHPIKDEHGATRGCVSLDLLKADYDKLWASEPLKRTMSDTGIAVFRAVHPGTYS